MEDDLGLELLMNKKKANSDVGSVISSRSGRGGVAESVKSITIEPEVIDIKSYRQDRKKEEYDDDDDMSIISRSISEVSSQRPKIVRKDKKKSSQHSRSSVSESEISDESSSSYSEGNSTEAAESLADFISKKGNRISEEDILNEKREILYQFDRLEKKGIKLPRKFSLASSLDEMKQELARIKRDRELDASIGFQKKTLITVVSGIEILNDMFDPVGAKLSGWSESVNENIDDYESTFEELYDKYKGKAQMAPELKLLLMLVGSGFMFHITNSMFKSSSTPGLEEVLKQNPELAKQFAAATANTMANNTQSSPMMRGLGGMFSSMFGGGGGGPLAGLFGGSGFTSGGGMMNQQPPQQQSFGGPTMRGPTNVEDILRDIDNNDRIEVMSTVTASDAVTDDNSIANLLMTKKPRKNAAKGKGRKINLDI